MVAIFIKYKNNHTEQIVVEDWSHDNGSFRYVKLYDDQKTVIDLKEVRQLSVVEYPMTGPESVLFRYDGGESNPQL